MHQGARTFQDLPLSSLSIVLYCAVRDGRPLELREPNLHSKQQSEETERMNSEAHAPHYGCIPQAAHDASSHKLSARTHSHTTASPREV